MSESAMSQVSDRPGLPVGPAANGASSLDGASPVDLSEPRPAGTRPEHAHRAQARRVPKWLLVLGLFGALAVVAAMAVGVVVYKGQKIPQVVVVRPMAAVVHNYPGGIGNVEALPDDVFSLTPQLLGASFPVEVASVDATNGEDVRPGTPLVTLNATQLGLNVTEDRLQLSYATAALKAVEAGPTASSAGLVQSLQAAVALDQESLALAEGDPTVIVSPMSGQVSRLSVSPGQVVSPGMVVAQVEDISQIEVTAGVQLTDMSTIHVGQPATVTFSALPGVSLPGTVVATTPEASAGGLEGTVVVKADNLASSPVPLGTTAYVSIDAAVHASMTLPLVAVANLTLDPAVFIVRNGRAYRALVTVGAVDERRAQILTGLSPGQVVAVTGTQLLTDGERVRVEQVLTSAS